MLLAAMGFQLSHALHLVVRLAHFCPRTWLALGARSNGYCKCQMAAIRTLRRALRSNEIELGMQGHCKAPGAPQELMRQLGHIGCEDGINAPCPVHFTPRGGRQAAKRIGVKHTPPLILGQEVACRGQRYHCSRRF